MSDLVSAPPARTPDQDRMASSLMQQSPSLRALVASPGAVGMIVSQMIKDAEAGRISADSIGRTLIRMTELAFEPYRAEIAKAMLGDIKGGEPLSLPLSHPINAPYLDPEARRGGPLPHAPAEEIVIRQGVLASRVHVKIGQLDIEISDTGELIKTFLQRGPNPDDGMAFPPGYRVTKEYPDELVTVSDLYLRVAIAAGYELLPKEIRTALIGVSNALPPAGPE